MSWGDGEMWIVSGGGRLARSGGLVLRHDFHAHRCDAVMLDVEDEEAAAAIDQRLFLFREVAFDCQEHAGEGLAFLGHIPVVVGVESGDAEEVVEQGFPSKI